MLQDSTDRLGWSLVWLYARLHRFKALRARRRSWPLTACVLFQTLVCVNLQTIAMRKCREGKHVAMETTSKERVAICCDVESFKQRLMLSDDNGNMRVRRHLKNQIACCRHVYGDKGEKYPKPLNRLWTIFFMQNENIWLNYLMVAEMWCCRSLTATLWTDKSNEVILTYANIGWNDLHFSVKCVIHSGVVCIVVKAFYYLIFFARACHVWVGM